MSPRSLSLALLLLFSMPPAAFAAGPALDRSMTYAADARARAFERVQADRTLRGIGTVEHVDERYGVPNFVRIHSSPVPARGTSHESAARAHLARMAPLYGLDARDAREAPLRYVHDTGHGAIIVAFTQRVGGIDVFRDEIKVLMDRSLRVRALTGSIPSQSPNGRAALPSFRLSSVDAAARALEDFAGAPVPGGSLAPAGDASGYETFLPGPDLAAAARLTPDRAIRVRKVYFHLPASLAPGWHVELIGPGEAYAYVVSAEDGGLLFRHSLVASDAFSYRVWADGSSPYTPLDGPQGSAATPHPTGTPDAYAPALAAPSLVTLQNSPFSMNDPWLSSGATQTSGNNVDAYADLASPDGFSAGDLRATTTGPATFDRSYDPSQPPNASAAQQMAAVTQLFFVNNFLHDWFYDAGFDEASGNAQLNNYGRGGAGNDPILAEAQDFGGTNNANMTTPSDGSSPRMQMYVFTPASAGVVVNGIGISGTRLAGAASFGPQVFSTAGQVALANDAVAPVTDGCEAIGPAVNGRIALIDRGSCNFTDKVLNAQAAGAIGVLIVDNVSSWLPPGMGGTAPTITIPTLSVTQALGDSLKVALAAGTLIVTLDRPAEVNRDGTIDNQVVAHEWGHYISNRLVANGSGLTTQMAAALGEGWGDFHALLVTVRPEDASAPANADFSGVYAMGGYALGGSYLPSYYFGFRRVPYSTDMTKNALTFQHIQNSATLPSGPPTVILAPDNAEVHNAGEVWATMLWECYAALLRDTGRLTFAQAQLRMRDYLVAAYKLTPAAPTLTEARDALLEAAAAGDPADYVLFWQAFAKRGAGMGAVSPDRNSTTNEGVVESYVVGGDLAFVAGTVDDDVTSCDTDGYLDEGETGTLTVTLLNTGAVDLSATTGSISSANPAVSFPSGTALSFSPSTPYGPATASVPVKLQGATGFQALAFQVSFGDPAQVTANPQLASFSAYGRANEVPSATETAEAPVLACTFGGTPGLDGGPWERLEITPTAHKLYGPDPGSVSDQWVETPDLAVAPAGNFTFTFSHSFSFERSGASRYDGGVMELSSDGGATWVDIGAAASPGYNGTIFTGSGNPLSGRLAWTGANTGYPAPVLVTVNLGTAHAGQTVRIRFRVGTDEAVSAPGWLIDDLAFSNLTNTPFFAIVADTTVCAPAAVGDELPGELAFALEGTLPARGDVRMSFALPAAEQVEIAVLDVAGRRVATPAKGAYPAGRHSAVWERGTAVSSGVYFVRMTVAGRSLTRRVVALW